MELKIGTNIKRLRLEKGLTQEELAKLLRVTTAAVSKWEARNSSPDISMLFPFAEIFHVSTDELLGYDKAKEAANIGKEIAEYKNLRVEGRPAEASKQITKARKLYPYDYRIMNAYMWDKVGGTSETDTKALLENQSELAEICACILDGCTQDDLRAEALNMKAKLLYAEGDIDGALKILSQLPGWQAPFVTEQLFPKDTQEFRDWNKKNCYGFIDVMAIKLARMVWFEPSPPTAERIERLEQMAEAFSEMSSKMDLPFFCIGEQAVYAVLANMLTEEGATAEDVMRIREKQFASMKKVMKLAQSDKILFESIERTYQTHDLVSWQKSCLLNSPLPQFEKLREDPEYMEMISK